ncbi:UDP-N-acetylmuramoyl-tripeptide--D-alanyl-D-alanine ligase [Kineosporiaceae bacterium SCSIO 59966]|nr:UDP-N-acetylmuramoyl-tripeptide--D-alanyl-D-alanine ligase [Kineosporiaceae bacterium SCSIO 59966]
MIPLTLAEVADAVGGRLAGGAAPDSVVTGPVVVDSRQAAPGALFVALPGQRADGHDFAAAAVGQGAVAVLAERELDVPCVVVGSGTGALGALARAVVDRLTAPRPGSAPGLDVVALTGSSGKTSTKDLLAAVLGAAGPTVAPSGSFNNEVGVPLTVLRADEQTRFLVVEMGARGVGHIAHLCQVVPPRVGVVLNVGSAHLSEFGSREGTARAKGELVEALPPARRGGVAVLNADDDLVARMATRTTAAVHWFGESARATIRAQDVDLDAGRPVLTLVTPAGSAPVRLRLYGEHQVPNALAAATVALALGLELPAVAEALSAAEPASRYRMEVTERPDGVTVINDAYNANPESVRAALKALVAIGRGRRTWAVLGEMLELGESSAAEHDAVGRLAVRLDVSRLVAVGAGARAVHTGAAHEGSWGEESLAVPDVAAAEALLAEELRPGDVVLVKASNAVGLHALGERLAAGGHRPDDAGEVVR